MLITSCKKEQSATITGTIENYGDEPVLLFQRMISNSPDTVVVTDNQFSIEIPANTPQFFSLKYGKTWKELFLAPGYALVISFDASDPENTFKIEGKGGIENTINDSVDFKLQHVDFRAIFSLEPETASRTIDSTFESISKYFNTIATSQPLDPLFIEYKDKAITYESLSLKTSYGTRKSMKDSAFFDYLKNYDLEVEKYLCIPQYYRLLSDVINYKANKFLSDSEEENPDSPEIWLDAVLKQIEQIQSEKIKEYLTFSEINNHLGYYGLKNFEKYDSYFKNHVTLSSYMNEYQKNYNKKLLIAPGQTAPDFTCADIDSNFYSLNDFKGKLVYIDFWATWCGPCRRELPEYIKLYNEYKDKNIVFVSISVDHDKENWEKSVKEHLPEYISLHAKDAWNSDVSKSYQISGIPTFVLIDKDGKIIDSQAPRPSSDDIRPTLDKHL